MEIQYWRCPMVGRNEGTTRSFGEGLCRKGYWFAEIIVYKITNMNVWNRTYTKQSTFVWNLWRWCRRSINSKPFYIWSTTRIKNFNDSNVNPDAPSIPCRYKHLNKIFNHFWKRRTKEYLATIRDLQKIKASKGAIDIKVFGY